MDTKKQLKDLGLRAADAETSTTYLLAQETSSGVDAQKIQLKGVYDVVDNKIAAFSASAATACAPRINAQGGSNNYAPINNPTFTGVISGITPSMVGLGNVANESKATMFSDPIFTGKPLTTTPVWGDYLTNPNRNKQIVDVEYLDYAMSIGNPNGRFSIVLTKSSNVNVEGGQSITGLDNDSMWNVDGTPKIEFNAKHDQLAYNDVTKRLYKCKTSDSLPRSWQSVNWNAYNIGSNKWQTIDYIYDVGLFINSVDATNTSPYNNNSTTSKSYVDGRFTSIETSLKTGYINSDQIPNINFTGLSVVAPGLLRIERSDASSISSIQLGSLIYMYDVHSSNVGQGTVVSITHYSGYSIVDIGYSISLGLPINSIYVRNTNIKSPVIDFRNALPIKADSNIVYLNASLLPSKYGIYNIGSSDVRWKDIYNKDGVVGSSDARLKTTVKVFTQNELNASKELSREIGTYQWLDSVEEKGDNARKHIGMTVQRAIEIMTNNNLNPFEYGFICYDEWETTYKSAQPAIEAKEAWTEEIKRFNDNGEEFVYQTIEHEAIKGQAEILPNTIVEREAGNVYSFRYTELLAFIARGFEERLTLLENK